MSSPAVCAMAIGALHAQPAANSAIAAIHRLLIVCFSPRARSMPVRKHRPDLRVFLAQHPRAEALQSALLRQLIALAKGAQVGEVDPFQHLVPIEVEPRSTIHV